MTTIAFDGKTLATDSLMTASGVRFGTVDKIFKLNDGSVLAICGAYSLAQPLIDWLNGIAEMPGYDADETISGILIPSDESHPLEISTKYYKFRACIPWAGGSGEAIALTAMKCGKSAIEAVKIACELDIYSGLPVQSCEIHF